MKKGDIVSIEHYIGTELLNTHKGKVMWVDNDQASVQDEGNSSSYLVFNPLDTDYKVTVLVDAAPSFQSQVASLSDEQLRAAVDSMRSGRIIPTPVAKVKKEKAPALSEADKQFQALVAQLTPEEQAKLRIKMGLA